jgi:hypothetical protein
MVTRDLLDETASRPEASAEEDRECVAMIRMQQCQIALLVWFGDMYNRRISQILLRSPNSEQSVVQKPCSIRPDSLKIGVWSDEERGSPMMLQESAKVCVQFH